jgi:hypothetical protein
MIEKNYYTVFKKEIGNPLHSYFNFLDENDWEELFDDYYNRELFYLLRIFDIPKGETIHSYGLIYVKNVTGHVRELITRANNTLLTKYLREDRTEILYDFFSAVSYLKLSIDHGLIVRFIENKRNSVHLREKAAFTIITVHDNALNPFWDRIDLKVDTFLIPPYLAFYSNKNPLLGFQTLLTLEKEPQDLENYETPILYSLLQIATSPSEIQIFNKLKSKFSPWLRDFIKEIFDEYSELSVLEMALKSPYENILLELSLDPEILDDIRVPLVMRNSLQDLLEKIKKKPSLIRIVNDEQISVIDPTYIDSLDDLIEKLKEKLKSMQIGVINDPANDDVFEATEKKIYYRVPTLFLYPYFLDETRTDELGAGVIAYGMQTCMALVINKKNKKYKEWELLRAAAELDLNNSLSKKRTNSEIDRSISVLESTLWLRSLIEQTYRAKKGEIHTVRGYVFNSIIQQFAEDNIKDNKKLGEVLMLSIDVDNIKKQLPFYKENIDVSEKFNVDQILLLDPADALCVSKNGNRLCKNLNHEFDVLYVKHGLNIPVGIGYSLFALPHLLKNNNWKILQNFMVENLKIKNRITSSSHEEILNSIGIMLIDNPYLPQYINIEP